VRQGLIPAFRQSTSQAGAGLGSFRDADWLATDRALLVCRVSFHAAHTILVGRSKLHFLQSARPKLTIPALAVPVGSGIGWNHKAQSRLTQISEPFITEMH